MTSAQQPADEFDAVRMVVEVLKNLKTDEQARVIRWAQEKLGLASAPPLPTTVSGSSGHGSAQLAASDIASFMQAKSPSNDVQFATAVAYYYAFEAPGAAKKTEITAADLKEATRLTQRLRLASPIVTLHNAVKRGYLDKGVEKGTFRVNTVGENLVAMSLPMGSTAKRSRKSRPAKKK